MPTHTEFQLNEIDGNDLEDLAIDLLTRQDKYEGIDPQGGRSRDGGKDGLLLDSPSGRNIILHISRREDWKNKLKTDLGKAADHNREYDVFIYFTNRVVTGNQKPIPDVAESFVNKHGWHIDIWDRDRIRAALDNNHQDLRRIHLNIAEDEDPANKAERLITRRISSIKQRVDELPQPIEDGPVAVFHVIPHDSVAGRTNLHVDDLPEIPIPGLGGRSNRKTTDGRVTSRPGHPINEFQTQLTYHYINSGGWQEYVNTLFFKEDNKTISSKKFERHIGEAFENAQSAIEEMRIDPPIEICLSLLSVNGYSFTTGSGVSDRPRKIRRENVRGELHTVENIDIPNGEMLKPAFDRAWRAAGWEDGSRYYTESGHWRLE